ncbi:hypothetical protein DY000_02012157 [Brassica cretica]|uniref:Uncharacterized protein n=1 Tax=Brassica cretica TaxID=69181 RepID=A0ABQ7D1U6_BRACR|nr:hypothetical protein DY000_02012157 [Brassica cretica]
MGEFSCQEVLISLKMNKSSSLEHPLRRYSTTGGLLCFYDRSKLEIVQKVGISPSCSVVQCAWHPRYLQHLETKAKEELTFFTTQLRAREVHVSALHVHQPPRKKSVDDYQPEPTHKPELPMSGPGHGGRVGTTGRSLLTQYLLKQGGMIKETWMEEYPREAILKYAEVAIKDPKFIAPAYSQTQPETILAKSDDDEEGDVKK